MREKEKSFQKMKHSGDELDAEHAFQSEKKKYTEMKLCTPFCPETDCIFQGKHDPLVLSLVNLRESRTTSLDQWKADINEAQGRCAFNHTIPDPNPDFRYPLLHWAAVLGKVKAVKWLLQKGYVDLNKNPDQHEYSLPNVANKMVLFSTVRWLHEGVKTRETGAICKLFTNIVDAFLKLDADHPDVLLAQDDHNNDTVLHLCARGEEDSTAPFFHYLKRILGKLQEYSEKNDKLPLKDILKTENGAGDSFLHLLARSNKREEAKKLIKYAIEKFPQQFLEKVKDAEGKTAEDILKESRSVPCLENEEDSDEEDEKSLKNCGHVEQPEVRPLSPDGSNDGRERPDGAETIEVDSLPTPSQGHILSSQLRAGVCPEAQSYLGGEIEGDQITQEISNLAENQVRSVKSNEQTPPPRIFQEPVPDETLNHSTTSLQSLCKTVVLDEDHDEGPAKDFCGAEISTPSQSVNSQPVSNIGALRRAQNEVKTLIRETEMELHQVTFELEEVTRKLGEFKEKVKKLREEKDKKEATVQNLKEKVKCFKESLLKLE